MGFVVTAPRTSRRVLPAPDTETRAAPTPVRDPDWAANRPQRDHE